VEYGQPISYLVLEPGTEVISGDGERVGKVQRVVADTVDDIFEGVVIDTRLGPGGLHYVDAEQIAEMYEKALVLKVRTADVEQLPKPS
jgi:hypothetical protein